VTTQRNLQLGSNILGEADWLRGKKIARWTILPALTETSSARKHKPQQKRPAYTGWPKLFPRKEHSRLENLARSVIACVLRIQQNFSLAPSEKFSVGGSTLKQK
jgi:hypothetical protein